MTETEQNHHACFATASPLMVSRTSALETRKQSSITATEMVKDPIQMKLNSHCTSYTLTPNVLRLKCERFNSQKK